jgi:hypothetical protein
MIFAHESWRGGSVNHYVCTSCSERFTAIRVESNKVDEEMDSADSGGFVDSSAADVPLSNIQTDVYTKGTRARVAQTNIDCQAESAAKSEKSASPAPISAPQILLRSRRERQAQAQTESEVESESEPESESE